MMHNHPFIVLFFFKLFNSSQLQMDTVMLKNNRYFWPRQNADKPE